MQGNRRSGGRWIGLLSAALVLAGCVEQPSSSPPITTPNQSAVSVWALGDSQGALSNDPARGLPWTVRLGPAVGNGADAMEGAGWTVAGTHTGRTVPQRAADLARTNTIRRYIVMAGINDLSAQRTVAQMLSGATLLADQARSAGATVLWVGVVPVPKLAPIANREADRRAFNAALAQRYGASFVDCSSKLADAAGWLRTDYSLSPSNLHLNNAGEQVLANCISAVR